MNIRSEVNLIKDQIIVDSGKSEVAKTLEMGPKPLEGDSRKLGKRKYKPHLAHLLYSNYNREYATSTNKISKITHKPERFVLLKAK